MENNSKVWDEIASLRGSINSSRNTQPKEITSSAPYQFSHSRGNRGYHRGGFRGRVHGFRGSRGRGRGLFPIRNRTLVVNNNTSDESNYVSTISSNGLKLINKDIYKKELSAINLTKEQKIDALRDAKSKITQKRLETRASKNAVRLDLCDRCVIENDLFAISRYGAKLAALHVPQGRKSRIILWNGFKYKRVKKNGNLKLMDQKIFLKEQCRYFQKTGVCSRGNACKYTHNVANVALCKSFINRACDGSCPLSHAPNEFNVPICKFFQTGSCTNPDCIYLHTKPVLELICRPFAIGGYCFRGRNCKFTHSFECPDYQLTRRCPRGRSCTLKHSNKDNLDSRLIFETLDPSYYQLPDLTKEYQVSEDPRLQKNEFENNYKVDYSDDSDASEVSDDDDTGSHISQGGSIDMNADFIQF